MTTKEKILYEALTLFSINGYEAVSMRDLAAVVGIRQSSIYKHYVNKQAILDAIVIRVTEEIDQLFEKMNVPIIDEQNSLSRYLKMETAEIASLCTKMLLAQQSNELISKFRQLVTIEQYQNKVLRECFHEMFIDKQLFYIEKVFSYLLQQDVLKQGDPKQMAIAFFSPFFMLQYKYDEDKEKLEQVLRTYVVQFINEHLEEE